MKDYRVYKIPTDSPEDVSGLKDLLNSKEIKPEEIVAIMNMTEGLGFARGYANLAHSVLLAEELGCTIEEVPRKIPLIMIGGCSGLVAPYSAVFVEREGKEETAKKDEKRFAFGVSVTRDFKPEEQGTSVQIEAVKDATLDAMKKARIADVKDIHCVQVKGPWLTPALIAEAEKRGEKVVTNNLDLAGGYSRGASALGAAVALGEVRSNQAKDALLEDLTVHSSFASASSGTERTNCAVIVMGNSTHSSSKYRIGHGIMKDGADAAGVIEAIKNAGLNTGLDNIESVQQKIDHVFVKSAVDGTGSCRGRRHVLTSDFLAPYSWLLGKAVIHATVTSIVGDPMMQVSGGFEHQGPLGGGLVAVITLAD
jgi:cyanuric acid amidohydrolase